MEKGTIKAPNIEWNLTLDTKLIDFAYMGLISEGLAEQMEMTVGQVSGRLKFFGLSLDKVRQWKREGKTKAEIMQIVEARLAEEDALPKPDPLAQLLQSAVEGQNRLIDIWGRIESLLRISPGVPTPLLTLARDKDDAAA